MTAAFRPNRAGFLTVLNSPEATQACRSEAQAIARNVEAIQPDADVVVDTYRTDRSAASVTIRDVRARTWAVRDGIWTRAAGAAGHEVTTK
jgi:phenylpyruvate tautomerase PptA (4-oxalocrotonate tautomerase family)